MAVTDSIPLPLSANHPLSHTIGPPFYYHDAFGHPPYFQLNFEENFRSQQFVQEHRGVPNLNQALLINAVREQANVSHLGCATPPQQPDDPKDPAQPAKAPSTAAAATDPLPTLPAQTLNSCQKVLDVEPSSNMIIYIMNPCGYVGRPVKHSRARRACQHCHEAKRRCSDEQPCTRCVNRKRECKPAPRRVKKLDKLGS